MRHLGNPLSFSARCVVKAAVANQKLAEPESEVVFLGFALAECTVMVDTHAVKYLRAIHRAALELAVQNRFGMDIGGFWITAQQIPELRSIVNFYPPQEASLVAETLEAYLAAQLDGLVFVNQQVVSFV